MLGVRDRPQRRPFPRLYRERFGGDLGRVIIRASVENNSGTGDYYGASLDVNINIPSMDLDV